MGHVTISLYIVVVHISESLKTGSVTLLLTVRKALTLETPSPLASSLHINCLFYKSWLNNMFF